MKNPKLTKKEMKEPAQVTIGRIKRIAKDMKNMRLYNLADKLGDQILQISKIF